MTDSRFLLLTLILAFGVQITRWLPFLLFGKKEQPPAFINYLGEVLPAAMMGLLVVYCFRDMSAGNVLPAVIASGVVVGIHLWKRNMIFSIISGTAVYMILVNLVFV